MSGGAMSKAIQSGPYQVIWLIRRLFRALAQRSNENLEGFGISVADRAVMEFLHPAKELSVPGLVVTKENPRHKRSPLIGLNNKGRKLFGAVLKKDEQAVRLLFSNISKKNVQITQQTLQFLLNELN
jgi:hypothetical protein